MENALVNDTVENGQRREVALLIRKGNFSKARRPKRLV